jgi:hypothetical protein
MKTAVRWRVASVEGRPLSGARAENVASRPPTAAKAAAAPLEL